MAASPLFLKRTPRFLTSGTAVARVFLVVGLVVALALVLAVWFRSARSFSTSPAEGTPEGALHAHDDYLGVFPDSVPAKSSSTRSPYPCSCATTRHLTPLHSWSERT